MIQNETLKALLKTIEKSGKQTKELYIELEIDAGTWSKILRGTAHFPLEKLHKLFAICGNHILLEHLAEKAGCIVMTKADREELELRYEHAVQFSKDMIRK